MKGSENNGSDKNQAMTKIMTKETLGMVVFLFCLIVFLILVTGSAIFGEVGSAITGFFLGCFGYLAYPLVLTCGYAGLMKAIGKKAFGKKYLFPALLFLLSFFFILHLALTTRYLYGEEGNVVSYGEYLVGCYRGGADGSVPGGILFGVVCYLLFRVFSLVGSYIVYSLLFLFSVYLILRVTPLWGMLTGNSPAERDGEGKRAIRPEKKSFFARFGRDKGGIGRVAPSPAPSPAPSAPAAKSEPAARPVGSDGLFMGAPSYSGGYSDSAFNPPSYSGGYSDSAFAPPSYSRSEREFSRARGEDGEEPDILSVDPMRSYKENLIFDANSEFNRPGRRGAAQPKPLSETLPPKVSPSYSERYAKEAEEGREVAAARRITPDLPAYRAGSTERAGAPLPNDAETYRPSFKATPAADETPRAETPRADSAQQTRVFTFGDEETKPLPDLPKFTSPEREEAERGEGSEPDPIEIPAETNPPATEEVAEEEPRPEENARRESSFRNYFSGGNVPIRTEIEITPDMYDDLSVLDSAAPSARPLPEQPSAPEEELPTDSYEDPSSQTEEDELEREDFRAPADEDPYSLEEGEKKEERGEEYEEETRAERAAKSFADEFEEDYSEDYVEEEQPAAEEPVRVQPVRRPYVYPSAEGLKTYESKIHVTEEEVRQKSEIIEKTLAGFKVDAKVRKVTCGASVTRYDVDIPMNITNNAVIRHQSEIGMRLQAKDGVNIYSNAKEGMISIEVPNEQRATVGVKPFLSDPSFLKDKPGSLKFVLGQDLEGKLVFGDIVSMTHILIAGTTGAGKSSGLNSMLISLLFRYTPEELRLILIDPKQVEFTVYEGIPHLVINEIISQAPKALAAFKWAVTEMERRYSLFEQKTRKHTLVADIDEYNENLLEGEERLARIVIVVDEFADLMLSFAKELEACVQRLTQKARAAGIHLVIATQRPSVNVITGVIKSNLPTRIAFRVIQENDSRIVLDCQGAEKLLGSGDMLYKTGFECQRLQGAYISKPEVQAFVREVKEHNEGYFDQSAAEYINNEQTESDETRGGEEEKKDAQYIKALEIVVEMGSASISLIQRKCSVGYNHAGRIFEWMEKMKYIEPFSGNAKARKVLLSKEEFLAKYGKN